MTLIVPVQQARALAVERRVEAANAAVRARRGIPVAEKRCTGCEVVKPLREYGSNPASPDGKYSRCLQCERVKDRRRGRTPGRAVNTRAVNRALARLRDRHRTEYEAILAEELKAARTEAATIAATTPPSPDPHQGVARLLPGPRPATQTVLDRIREDVGACPTCIASHDTGHTCPTCGATP